MPRVKLNYLPKPKQALFHKSNATECLFGGAKSPGKTCALVMEATQYCLENPGSEAYLFRKTYDDLKSLLIKEFESRVPAEIYRMDHADYVATFLNKSKIYFRYIRNLIDANKYNGRSIPFIGVDELTEHCKESIQILLSCNRSAEGFPVRFRATSNPGNIGHGWVKERFILPTQYGKVGAIDKVTGNSIAFIPANVYDGVLVERDPAYVKRLENLPESERQAYLFGNWDIFAGQFFMEFGIHNREEPFMLPTDCMGKLFGSLDHGIAHPTSFGLNFLDPKNKMHRLCTYHNNGGTTEGHAKSIWEMINGFRFSHCIFPSEIYYDPSMDTTRKMTEQMYQSDIGIYRQIFKLRKESEHTKFIPGNNRKSDGCHIMKEMFAIGNGEPRFMYFNKYNESFKEGIEAVMTDKNNPETYAKMDGDDPADESRYGMVAAYTRMSQAVAVQETERRRVEEDRFEVEYAGQGSWMG